MAGKVYLNRYTLPPTLVYSTCPIYNPIEHIHYEYIKMSTADSVGVPMKESILFALISEYQRVIKMPVAHAAPSAASSKKKGLRLLRGTQRTPAAPR